MMRKYWSVEVVGDGENSRNSDYLYYGSNEEEAFCAIANFTQNEDEAYGMIGRSLIQGEAKRESRWNSENYIVARCWEDDDGSDETWDD